MAAASSEYTLERAIKDFSEFRSNLVIHLEFRKCISFDKIDLLVHFLSSKQNTT